MQPNANLTVKDQKLNSHHSFITVVDNIVYTLVNIWDLVGGGSTHMEYSTKLTVVKKIRN